ncbi:acetyl-CoA carboxylase carboxyltransferase subunit beta [Glycocaulis profundi]|nr:acetyl-CoA carboxylase carboxyltransferase subunit beta [Glycocaulis profundi]
MSWLSKLTPPGISKMFDKRDTPENLWVKCPVTGEMVFQKDLEAGLYVTPGGHHMRVGPDLRFQYTFDGGRHEEISIPDVARDPLKFKDDKPYSSRITAARKKTGREDAMAIGVGPVQGIETTILVQDFAFMGGSLGMGAGEAFIKACETAVAKKTPLVVFTAAGGARMQEGALSLMQMPRTTLGIEMLKDAGLPYIVVLTDPTTGGVTASYAMLGDVHIAEPGALIGFAGPRVIEQTIREKLPEGFQRSEYLLAKGMVDKVVHRRDLPRTLGNIMRVLLKRPAPTAGVPVKAPGPAAEPAKTNGAAA